MLLSFLVALVFQAPAHADRILHHGAIYTVNPSQVWAAATGTVLLEPGHSLQSYISQIRAEASHQIGTDWVLGWGFSMFNVFFGELFFAPTPLEVLNRAIPNRPAAIMEETSHAV